MMKINLSLIAVYLWLIMVVIMVVVLFIKNIAYRQQVTQLKKRLQELGSREQYLAYLRQHLRDKEKVSAIKALRQKFPELSLIEATQLWQQVNEEQNAANDK
ncbi:hypothetical protein [Psychrobacter sp. I-STPA6b]|uniref:hypothetical protein n=1 Tax=Psychrobacter sp. I-STPA6b TaxID=2585718 RepID=UPI001D0CBEC3|nr:hypothetical protein [Psychrobacter sp. I-STPA6b]